MFVLHQGLGDQQRSRPKGGLEKVIFADLCHIKKT